MPLKLRDRPRQNRIKLLLNKIMHLMIRAMPQTNRNRQPINRNRLQLLRLLMQEFLQAEIVEEHLVILD
jgi:hypothetical protein